MPSTAIELASILTALYCVTMIHQLFQGRVCTNTILVNFEITSRKKPLVQKRLNLQFFKDDDLEN